MASLRDSDDIRPRPVVLVPFDRSADAEAAIDWVARCLPQAEMTVLTVWHLGGGTDPDTAFAQASVGARHAAAGGVLARPRCQQAQSGVAGEIVRVADELDADLVVIGGHGREGEGYAQLGPTVLKVLESTGRPVLVVSGPDVPRGPERAEAGPAGGRHGTARVGAWVPATPEDERDGTR